MANNPVVNSLTFTGSVVGQATIQAQGIAGGLTFMLPNTSPIQGQLMTVSSINGANVFLGWASAQSLSNIPLSALSTVGATSGDVIQYNGTNWAVSSFVPGSGTVTSVALTAPVEFTVGGSPITGAGTLAITKATQTANTVWAGPTTGSAAVPAFRALVAADIPFAAPQTIAAVAHDFLTSYTASTGVFTAAQPAFTDLSGSIATGQIPASTITIAQINSKQGAGTAVQIAAGSFTNGHVVVFDATGNTSDSGIPGNTVFTTAGGTLSGDISFSQTPTANINAASGGNLNLNGNGGLIQIATTGGIGIAPESGQLVAITALKTVSTLTDSTGSVGASGQVLSSTVTGTAWVTDTDSTPGGSTGAIQYNNSGVFAGSSATISAGGQIVTASGSQSVTINPTQIIINANQAGNVGVTFSITGNGADDIFDWNSSGVSPTQQGKIDPSGNLFLSAGLGDHTSSTGANTNVLTSTGTQILWAAQSTLTVAESQVTGLTAALATIPALSDIAGNPPVSGDNHIASGFGAITAGGTVTITLTGSAVFSANSTYVVQVSRTSAVVGTGQLYSTNISGTQFSVNSSDNTDSTSLFAWTAIGK